MPKSTLIHGRDVRSCHLFAHAAAAFFLLALAPGLAGQAVATSVRDGNLLFHQFPVQHVFAGRPAPLDLHAAGARLFRTQLRGALRHGARFAGHYAVATWGCGTGCISAAVIDLRTGKATFFPATIEEWFDGSVFQVSQLDFKADSRAWHVVGVLNESGPPADRWYVWSGHAFKLLNSKPVTP